MSSYKSWIRHAILLTCALSIGCGSTATVTDASISRSKPVVTSDSTGTSRPISVVGDDTALEVASQLSQRGLVITQDQASVGTAAIVVVAVDATAGLRDVHRQLVQSLVKNRDAQVVWLFTKMSQIDDRELMDLQQNEAQELLEKIGVLTTNVRFAVDTEKTTVGPDTLKGWASVEEFLTGRRAK